MPRKQFDLIVFDWDGTLMDSTATIVKCIQSAAARPRPAVPSDAAAAHVIGLGLPEAMQAVMPDIDPALYPRMVERYRYHFLTKDHELVLFKGVREMLDELSQQGYFLAVATGKSRVGLNRALNAAACCRLFDATRCADETFSKPAPCNVARIDKGTGPGHAAHRYDRRHHARLAYGKQCRRLRHRRRVRRASGPAAAGMPPGLHGEERTRTARSG
jgi:phosphoglycolate phosphatase